MSSEFSSSAKLAAVEASPAAVAVHDKASWLALFTQDAVVNDPVGSKQHSTPAARERFYNTFIAPNAIRFAVDVDCISDMTVVRDLTINTAMPSGLRLGVPTHIRYQLAVVDGALRVRGLYAHWELRPMIAQVLRGGLPGLKTICSLSVNMLRHQGLGGALGFMRGFGGVGASGKRRAQAFLCAVQERCASNALAQCADQAVLTLPDGTPTDAQTLVSACDKLHWHKMIAAGRYVSVSVELDGRRGLLLFEFTGRGKRISALHWFL